MDAIYFISPQKDSVEAMIKDFSDFKKPMYSHAHILSTGVMPEDLVTKIASSPMKPRIKTLKEVNIDFLAIERNVFTLNYTNDFQLAYGDPDRKSFSNKIADKIVAFCATEGMIPYVRHSKSEIATLTANSVHDKLEKAKKMGLTKKKSVIIILDRSVDCLAPLLHEFTYQAMAYDLMKIDPMGMYDEVDAKGTKSGKKHNLDEYDELWVQHRHRHFADLGSTAKKQFDDFLAQHKDLTDANKKDNKKDAADISSMIRKLPQYQGKLSNFALHLNLIISLKHKFEQQSLAKVALEEQNMAVGEDPDHNKLKDVLNTIGPILKSGDISDQDKLRLVMIYLITQGDSKRSRVVKHADLSEGDEAIIDNLAHLGVKLSQSMSLSKVVNKLFGGKSKKSDVGIHLSRYVPKVKQIAEECIEGNLSTSEYPYVQEPSSSFTFVKGSKKSSSSSKKEESDDVDVSGLDNSGPSWSKKKGKKSSSSSKSSSKDDEKQVESEDRLDKKLFIFVIGGITHSEMRSAYELDIQYKMDVHVGSTSILTPQDFLKKLKSLRKKGKSADY
jgi:hypothetical protein